MVRGVQRDQLRARDHVIVEEKHNGGLRSLEGVVARGRRTLSRRVLKHHQREWTYEAG
jgi:hypothetical protein